jgi:hypothetical protein
MSCSEYFELPVPEIDRFSAQFVDKNFLRHRRALSSTVIGTPNVWKFPGAAADLQDGHLKRQLRITDTDYGLPIRITLQPP